MEFINLERAFGSSKHVRRHFHKAMNSAAQMDYPDALFDAYLTFEREEGSLEDFIAASAFVDKQKKTMKEREIKRAEKEGKEMEKKGAKPGKGDGNKKRPSAENGEARNGQPAVKKRKNENDDAVGKKLSTNASDAEGVFKVPHLPKLSPKSKGAAPTTLSGETSGSKVDKDAPASTAAPAPVAPPVDEALEKRDRTIFVSNMNFSASEDDLREAFKFCGKITSIRLVSG